MEKKSLYIYKLDEQGNKVKFPNSDMPAKLGEYTYSAQRMAGTPTLTGALDYPVCLDDEWSGEEFVEFRGEKYYVDQIPTSSKDNKSIMYKHELQFVSERIVLENVYFMDVVTSGTDTYHSNSTSVKFMGDIHEFVIRLNASMTKSGIGYSVVIDDDITSDSKLVSLDNVYLADALQSIYTIYDLPYYFVGKVCHIGYTENVISTPFEYRKGLVSIKKTNANYKIINRVTGVGSTDNIPFYYPNDTQYGEIDFNTSGFNNSSVRSIDYQLLKSNIPNFLAKTLTWDIRTVSITWGGRTGRISFKEGEHISKFISTCHLFASKGDSFTLLPKLTVSDGGYISINHVVHVDGVALPYSNKGYNINIGVSGRTYSIRIEWEVTIDVYSGAARSVSDVSEIQGPESRKGWIYDDLGDSKFVKSSDAGIYLSDETLLSTGDTISFTKDKYIEPSGALMPPIYRQSGGAKRFYNALNNTYKIPGTNDYYSFKNIYSAKNVKEIKVDFSDIKPTIEGVANASGQLFGEIADVAFDANDSDELGTGKGKNVFNGTDEYVHSYFYIKLHVYNGDYGFNLFEQGLEGGTAVINMTTGNCAACEFEIGVTYNDDGGRAYNPVLVDNTGNLIPGDFEQKVASNTSQYVESQQDTSGNEVWIAVKKDNNSFKVVMPNATNNYKPSIGDKFVITGIKMPKPIILAAEKRLEEALIKYLSENNDEKFTFSINFSRVFLADNSHLSDVLNENARIYIKYNNREYFMYVSSFTCKADKNCLYDISVELTDKLSANVPALRSTIADIAGDIIGEKWSNIPASDIIAKSLRHFLSKTRSDRTPYSLEIGEDLTVERLLKVLTRLEVGEAIDSLITGKGIIAENGRIQADRMELRSSLTVLRLIINEIQAMAGDYSFSDCGYIERVDKIDDTTYKLWMEKRTDTDWTNLDEHDVLLSIVNSLLTGGTDYYSSWFRCVAKNRNENSLTVVLYPDSEVPGGKNYPPVEGYNVTRKGNAVMPEAGETNERAQSWLISSREGRIMFLQNVFKPILEDYNYAISIGRFPSVKMVRKLPISPTDVGIMAKTIVAENFYQADWNGDIIPKKVDRGEWSLAVAQGESPYRNVSHEVTLENQSVVTQLEQHTVYHYGCKWGCVIDKTTDEPKWNAPGWILLEGDKNYHLDFTSTNGWQFFHRSVDTVVSAVVSYGNRDITEVLMASDGVQVEWLRDTGNVPADNAWQPTYVDGKKHTIHLTRADMGSEWGISVRRVRFVCRVFIPIGGGKFEKTENYIGFKL